MGKNTEKGKSRGVCVYEADYSEAVLTRVDAQYWKRERISGIEKIDEST